MSTDNNQITPSTVTQSAADIIVVDAATFNDLAKAQSGRKPTANKTKDRGSQNLTFSNLSP